MHPIQMPCEGWIILSGHWKPAGGDPRLALAGYNGGIGVIGIPESNWAQQTQQYATWGSGIYDDASSGASHQPAACRNGWSTNGMSLCRQAANRLGINP